MSVVMTMAAETAELLSPASIEVMHFLFEHPTSTEKLILDGVCVIKDGEQLSSVLTSLKSHGLLLLHMDALYSLSELGEVIIGKRDANSFLASEIIRRNLPKVACVRPYQYLWGDKKSLANIHVSAEHSESLSAWCFTDEERELISADPLIIQTSPLTRRLLARGIFQNVDGYITRTTLGQQLIDNPSLALPANTHWLGLGLYERLIVELMAKHEDLFAHQSAMLELLTVHGFAGTKKDLKSILDGLVKKNLLIYRSNKVYYLRHSLLIVMGLRKFVQGSDAQFLSMPNGDAVLARLKSGATNVLVSASGARLLKSRGLTAEKGSRKEMMSTSLETKQLSPGQLDGSATSKADTDVGKKQSHIGGVQAFLTLDDSLPKDQSAHASEPGCVGHVDDVEDAVSTFPTAEESAVMDAFMPEHSVEEPEEWFASAMQALSGFEVREPMLPSPKIKAAAAKATLLTKLSLMFEGEKGKDVRVMLDLIAKDLREIAAWQAAQKKRG